MTTISDKWTAYNQEVAKLESEVLDPVERFDRMAELFDNLQLWLKEFKYV